MFRRTIETFFGSTRWFFFIAAVGLVAAAYLVWIGPQPCDDAYITFRHAKNFAAHLAPSWNPEPPPVMGSTTPVYLFILGVLAWPFGISSIPLIALWINAFLLFLIVLLVFVAMNDLAKSRLAGLLASLLIGFNTVNLFVFAQGFENALLIVLLLLVFITLRNGGLVLPLALASLSPLVRPEGVLVVPIAVGFVFVVRKFNWKQIPALLIVPAAWIFFSLIYYRSFIPHSITAKKLFPSIYRPYTGGEINLIDRIFDLPSLVVPFWSEKISPILFNGSLDIETVSTWSAVRLWIAVPAVFLILLTLIRKKDSRIVYLLYSPLFILVYAWIGRTESWYFPSFVTFSLLMILGAVYLSIEWITQILNLSSSDFITRVKLKECLSIAAFILLFSANHYSIGNKADSGEGGRFISPQDPRGALWERAEKERCETYQRAAEYLNEQASGIETVLTSEVGVFGFYYDGPVIDSVGLCSPEVLEFYPPPAEDIFDENGQYRTFYNNFVPSRMVDTLKPVYVVNALPYITNLLVPGSEFQSTYDRLAVLGKAWGHPVHVYKRKRD